MIPLITRRSSMRGFPRISAGKCSAIFADCLSCQPAGGFATRFANYMRQLGLNPDGTSGPEAPPPSTTDPERGQMGPVCNKGGSTSPPGGWERRLIYAAMIDCEANADWLQGNSTKNPITTANIGEFFITEPTDGQVIYLEFVKEIVKDDDTGKLRSIIQLYPNPGQ